MENITDNKEYMKQYIKDNKAKFSANSLAYYYKNKTKCNNKTKERYRLKQGLLNPSSVQIRTKNIETRLAALLVKKAAFCKKLADEDLNKNIVII
jgi:hypothetical protein